MENIDPKILAVILQSIFALGMAALAATALAIAVKCWKRCNELEGLIWRHYNSHTRTYDSLYNRTNENRKEIDRVRKLAKKGARQ